MMKNIPSNKFTTLKLISSTIFLSAVLFTSSMSVMGANKQERVEVLPIVTIAPKYPQQALNEKREGWALVEFTVNQDGRVLDPQIIDSCSNGGTPPSRNEIIDFTSSNCTEDILFDSSALFAIKQFKFNPPIVEGSPTSIKGVHYLFRYNLQN